MKHFHISQGEPTSVPDVDALAQFIRSVDADNRLGAGALAEHICRWLSEKPTAANVAGQGCETPEMGRLRVAMEKAKAKADSTPFGTPGWKAAERAYGDALVAYGKAVEKGGAE